MNLVKKSNPLFSSIFDDLFPENRLDVPNYEKFSIPAINISEKKTSFVVEISIPGISKSNVVIEVEKKTLKVFSTSTYENPTEETTKYLRKDFDFKNFERKFTLPQIIDIENISATHVDGILVISLPKKIEEIAEKKMIEIS
jgi:HSP20 family protein